MDLHAHAHGEHGRLEQLLNQFLLKTLHVILDTRVPPIEPTSRGTGPIKKTDKWFNLALGDRPAAIESPSFWNRSLMEPMVIDIILVQELKHYSAPMFASRVKETVLERWVVRYEHERSVMAPQSGDPSYKKAYRKLIILLRSVHSMLRLLPAYKAFRKLCSQKQTCDFDVNYKICSFSTPFSRMEEYSFLPVEVQRGHLSVSLSYRRDLSEFNFDSIVSNLPEIIRDYVGSPLTDPVREFPSSSSDRARRFNSQSNSPFQRPHSWTSGIHRELSSQQDWRYSGSPPLYKLPCEYSVSANDRFIHRNQTQRSPAYRKDDLLSPPFSSSPSPSPPMRNHVLRRLHSETAPMSIPHQKFQHPNLSDPNRNSLPPMSPRNTKYGHSSRESSFCSRSMRGQDSLRYGGLSPSPVNTNQKMSKEDSGRFSSLMSSSSSPRAAFSWGSSRLSFQDDLGDSDFFGPFIVDDVDTPDMQSTSVNPSALVHMLRTAPPLRQDTNYNTSKTGFHNESGVASVFQEPRKTSDALEELKAYKELRDILLSKTAAPMVVKENVKN